MKIIDGKNIASKLNADLKKHLVTIKKKFKVNPCLIVILVGEIKASKIYVRNKEIIAREIGIESKVIKTSADISEKELLTIINECNHDDNIDGILVQLPLPQHINADNIIEAINPQKDVDGFHPENIGLLALGRPKVIPCTPLGCYKLLNSITSLEGKNIIILGRSNIVGKPLSYLLTSKNSTITLAHSKSKKINSLCANKDIVIAAIGAPNIVKKDWIKPGAIVIDVGINSVKDHTGKTKIIGDVDFHNILPIVSFITPVPGGVGPMTIHCLLENTIRLAISRKNIGYKLI